MKLHLFAGHLAAKRFKLFEHLKERSLQLRQLADASVDADKYIEKLKLCSQIFRQNFLISMMKTIL